MDKGIACHAMRNEVIKVVVLQLVVIFSIDVEWLVSPANVRRRGVGERAGSIVINDCWNLISLLADAATFVASIMASTCYSGWTGS